MATPRKKYADGKTQQEQQLSDRQKARNSGALDILIDVARGKPIPRRDIDGTVIAYDQVNPEVRVAAAEKLVRRFLPELKSIELEADAGVNFVIRADFPLPGSQRPSREHQHDPQMIEGSVSYDDLETGLRAADSASQKRHVARQQPTPAHEAVEPAPARTRRSRSLRKGAE